MAQSAITVTPENPTPPTNFTTVFLGTTPPTAPAQTVIDDGVAGTLTVFGTNRASVDNANFPSVAHEAAGTEVVVVAPDPRRAPTVSMSVLGSYTISPNQQHASTCRRPANPALASITPTTAISGATGTQLITCTGTAFTPGCRIWVNNRSAARRSSAPRR